MQESFCVEIYKKNTAAQSRKSHFMWKCSRKVCTYYPGILGTSQFCRLPNVFTVSRAHRFTSSCHTDILILRQHNSFFSSSEKSSKFLEHKPLLHPAIAPAQSKRTHGHFIRSILCCNLQEKGYTLYSAHFKSTPGI